MDTTAPQLGPVPQDVVIEKTRLEPPPGVSVATSGDAEGEVRLGPVTPEVVIEKTRLQPPPGISWAASTITEAELASRILASPAIALASAHSSGVVDNATAAQNIQDTADGKRAARSAYGNAPGGTTQIAARLLEGLLQLAATYRFSVSEIAGGSHSVNSRHYAGTAADINVINGQHVGKTHPDVNGFMESCRRLGATEVLGPGAPDHDTHVHCAWPR